MIRLKSVRSTAQQFAFQDTIRRLTFANSLLLLHTEMKDHPADVSPHRYTRVNKYRTTVRLDYRIRLRLDARVILLDSFKLRMTLASSVAVEGFYISRLTSAQYSTVRISSNFNPLSLSSSRIPFQATMRKKFDRLPLCSVTDRNGDVENMLTCLRVGRNKTSHASCSKHGYSALCNASTVSRSNEATS